MKTYSYLFKPISLGSLEIKNRIAMAPMATMYTGEEVNDRFIAFFQERSKGGAGLIIISHASPHPLGLAYPCSLALWDDKYIPGLARLAAAVKQEGSRIGLHIVHAGKYAPSTLIGTQAVSPSAILSNWTRETPRELSREEIKALVKDFARAAGRAKKAGFDLVELNAYSGYLIREFLSPLTNRRQDEYGGDLLNRMRFLLKIVAESRREVGSHFPLIVKISGDELLPGGNTLNEARIIARELEEAGIQALHVSPGGHETSQPLSPGFVPKGSFLYLSSAIKEVVKLPVITAHLGDPDLAEKALAEGKADMIAFGRQFIADPSFPLKLQSGKIQETRRCLRCCQGCYDRIFANQPVTCLVNPLAGREKEFYIKSASPKKKVMIAGAGPAGMEAAYTLASRGHEVHLYEKDSFLGGQIRLAAIPPGKEEFGLLIAYFEKVLPEAGVKVYLETSMTPALIEKEKPQVVVIATGSEPLIPEFSGYTSPKVVTSHQLLSGHDGVGNRVVIIGGGGTGCETALFLAGQDRQISLLEMLPSIGSDIGISRRSHVRKSLGKCGVQVITGAEVKEVNENGVVYLKDNREFTILADTVVLAMGVRPRNELFESLKDKISEIYLIGDALKPGKAMDAMRQGLEVGMRI